MSHPSTPISSDRRGPGLVLVGYRGSGKTTVGTMVAGSRRRPFLDLDHEIETRAGRPIRAIFAESGEEVFRDWEELALRALATQYPGAVLASGGGTVLRAVNRRLLRAFGIVVWLRAEPAALAQRIESDVRAGRERPALTTAGAVAEVAHVLAQRTPLYEEVADAAIETRDRAPEEIAALILDLWPADPDAFRENLPPCL